MCVIIVKPAGEKLPTKRFLKMAATVNNDGCGYITSSGHLHKCISFEAFWRDFREHARQEDDIILHFRWATHGSVRPGNCHPFHGMYNGRHVYFAHNGVLPIDSVDDKTDSQIFFEDYALPWLREFNGFTAVTDTFFERAVNGNRFAFLDPSGLHLYGHFVNYGGLLLSNTRFLQTVFHPMTTRYGGTGL